jgi:hypothetical protein
MPVSWPASRRPAPRMGLFQFQLQNLSRFALGQGIQRLIELRDLVGSKEILEERLVGSRLDSPAEAFGCTIHNKQTSRGEGLGDLLLNRRGHGAPGLSYITKIGDYTGDKLVNDNCDYDCNGDGTYESNWSFIW